MKNLLRNNRTFIVFVLAMVLMRSSYANWYPIPSGSMRPSLLEGDVVLVDMAAYDLKLPFSDVSLMRRHDPQRGDVVVFNSPANGTRLIKRLVAIGGDVVEMRDEQLLINGVPVPHEVRQQIAEPAGDGHVRALRGEEWLDQRRHALQFLPDVAARRSFGPVTVPADSYLFLGDNRDNSADSRYFGVVPRELLIGRAHHVLVSVDATGNWMPRWDRFAMIIE